MTTQPRSLSNVLHEFHGAFGTDVFGRRAEAFARMFGTPRFLIVQTAAIGWRPAQEAYSVIEAARAAST